MKDESDLKISRDKGKIIIEVNGNKFSIDQDDFQNNLNINAARGNSVLEASKGEWVDTTDTKHPMFYAIQYNETEDTVRLIIQDQDDNELINLDDLPLSTFSHDSEQLLKKKQSTTVRFSFPLLEEFEQNDQSEFDFSQSNWGSFKVFTYLGTKYFSLKDKDNNYVICDQGSDDLVYIELTEEKFERLTKDVHFITEREFTSSTEENFNELMSYVNNSPSTLTGSGTVYTAYTMSGVFKN